MDFELSEDQATISAAIAGLMKRFDDEYWGELSHTHSSQSDFCSAVASGGWLGLTIPEEFGGHGPRITEATIPVEEIARSGGRMNAARATHETRPPDLLHRLHLLVVWPQFL